MQWSSIMKKVTMTELKICLNYKVEAQLGNYAQLYPNPKLRDTVARSYTTFKFFQTYCFMPGFIA